MSLNKNPNVEEQDEHPIRSQPQTNVLLTSQYLHGFSSFDQLVVRQIPKGFWEANREFIIQNNYGQNVYQAFEENYRWGPQSIYTKVTDLQGNHLFEMHRQCHPYLFTLGCCLENINVSDSLGNVIGTIEQEWCAGFIIKDQSGETVFRIKPGSMCFRYNIEFKILTLNMTEIGKIFVNQREVMYRFTNDSDYFRITFPMDLDVRMKAVLIGAAFLTVPFYFKRG